MKKVLPLIAALCLVLALSLCALAACGQMPSGDGSNGGSGSLVNKNYSVGLEFTSFDNDESYLVSGIGTCEDTDIVIPPTYNSKPVTAIGWEAFKDCNLLTSVTIPNSVSSIRGYAFWDCSGLTSVTIGNGVTSIEYMAFRDCSGLTSITIPDSVSFIGDYAFRDCYGLEIITVASGNTIYHSSGNCLIETATKTLILGCKNSVIPTDGSVTSIGEEAFYNCSRLIGELVIPNSVTSIGDDAFYNCIRLTSVTIPNSVTSIGAGSFDGCIGLTSVIIPDSVTSISNYAFACCSGLTSVTIPDSVTSIGEEAFYNCSGLIGELIIPNSVTSIGVDAFRGCSGLTSVTIPDSVTSIGYEAFYGCSNLQYTEYDNALYLGNNTNPRIALIETKNKDISSYIINDNTKVIADRAFYNCSGLIGELIIPNSVTSIGVDAFRGCSGLTSVTIPDSVTSIGYYAFAGCSNLQYNEYDNALYLGNETNPYLVLIKAKNTESTSCNINANTKIIYGDAFYNYSGLTIVTIPDSVTSIGSYAFRGCSGLTSVTIGNGVTSIHYGAFRDCHYLKNIYIADVAAWCNISGLEYLMDEGSPNKKLYLNNELITNLVIPDSVTSISSYAFSCCSGLTSITIPDSVTSIGYEAFEDCSNLENIYITDVAAWCNISDLYNLMDNGSSNKKLYLNNELITNLVIPDSVTSISHTAFYNCSGLTSVTIPDSVTSIGYYAFAYCSGLTSVTIPDSVASIGVDAFRGCSGITSVTIPDSVTSIGDGAFSICSGLESITVASGNTKYHSKNNCLIETATKTLILCCNNSVIPTDGSVTSLGNEAFSCCSGLKEIKFNGTVAEWNAITKNWGWNVAVPATQVICTDGTVDLINPNL